MDKPQKCKTCQSVMVPDPEPYARNGRLLCFECDFKPDAIKGQIKAVSDPMDPILKNFPRMQLPKSDPILEPKEEMNPYLADVFQLVDEDESAIRDNMFGPSANYALLLGIARHRYIYKYAWAIPRKAALETIARYSPIVEVGAGSGYWAHLLQKLGCDVIAYDVAADNRYSKSGASFHHRWFEVLEGNESLAAKYPDRALFLCWPPYNEEMAFNCLNQYLGNTVIFVGEGAGGCTASDSFFKSLESEFTLTKTIELPVWFGLHDRLFVFERDKKLESLRGRTK